jgi:hypothetical protein
MMGYTETESGDEPKTVPLPTGNDLLTPKIAQEGDFVGQFL